MNQNKVLSVRNLVLIAMFSALAAVLETIQVAVPFAPPFYKLDFAELPVLIGGFAMGPAQAALIAIVKNLLKLLFKRNKHLLCRRARKHHWKLHVLRTGCPDLPQT